MKKSSFFNFIKVRCGICIALLHLKKPPSRTKDVILLQQVNNTIYFITFNHDYALSKLYALTTKFKQPYPQEYLMFTARLCIHDNTPCQFEPVPVPAFCYRVLRGNRNSYIRTRTSPVKTRVSSVVLNN